MKYYQFILFVFGLLILNACTENEIVPESTYNCNFEFADSSNIHPKAMVYQNILDENQKNDIVGATLLVKDQHGLWIGASGQADIASNVEMQPCNRFLIASISKSFTAAAVMRYVDAGLLHLDDHISEFLPEEVVTKIENADEATIRHLLNHTSGIADYYTTQYELDRINKEDNNWSQKEVLEYIYGKSATHPLGETYYYSNSNFLLLGIILEKASGKSLEVVYEEEVFSPLQLASGYYGQTLPIPNDLVKGYVDIYGNQQYVESQFLYKDELNTADGGIAINAYDLAMFYEGLLKGNLISQTSLNQMTDYFDLPSDWVDEDFGHFQNGLGLEHNQTAYGTSVGHTGGIDGFLSIAQYFPAQDATFVLLVNSGSYENEARLNIYRQTLATIFE